MAKYFKFTKDQVFKGNYQSNDRTALKIIDDHNDYPELVAIATANLPNESLEPDEVFIKDWSENEGVLNDLIEMGLLANLLVQFKLDFV